MPCLSDGRVADFRKVSADMKGNVLAAQAKLKSPQINSAIVQALIILAVNQWKLQLKVFFNGSTGLIL